MGGATNNRIEGLDGLRAVLAWWVVGGHLAQAFGQRVGLLNLNYLAVDVFIMLSGFVIASLIRIERESYGRYLLRRAARIFPLYLIVLAAASVLQPIAVAAVSSLPGNPTTDGWRSLAEQSLDGFGAYFAVHLPLLQGLVPESWLPNASYAILGVAWSVSLEWQFYVVAPCLIWLTDRRHLPWWLLLLAAGYLTEGVFGGAFLGHHLAKFLVGMFTFDAVARRSRRAAAYAVIAAIWTVIADGPLAAIPLGIWLLVMAMVAAPAGSALSSLGAPLRSRLLTALGRCSYSTYLIHTVVMTLAIWLTIGMRYRGIEVAVLTIGVTAALSLASFTWIEKPAMRLGKRLAAKIAEPIALVAAV